MPRIRELKLRSLAGSPEFGLAVDCCRYAFRRLGCNSPYPSGALDWPLFVEIVRFHRIAGLAWHALSQATFEKPDPMLRLLADDAAEIAATALRASAACAHLQTRFDGAKVNLLFLKGLTLGTLAYGTPALKAAVDIDLLIDFRDLHAAAAILRSLGYGLVSPKGSPSDKVLQSWHCDWKESLWAKANGSLQVDLHVAAADNPLLIPRISVHSPWQEVDVGNNVRLPTLALDELVAYLVVHGASSAWFRIKWIADFAALLDGFTGSEIERLYVRSQELGAGRTAGQAFLLADQLFGTLEQCASLRNELLQDPPTRQLFELALKFIVRRPAEPTASLFGTVPIHFAQFAAAPSLAYKVSELSGQARRFLWRARL